MDNDALMLGLQFDTNAADTAEQLKVVYDCLATIGNNAKKAGRELDSNLRKPQTNANQLIKRLKKVDKTLQSSIKNLDKYALKSKIAFAAIGASSIAAFKQYADMENKINKVTTISKKSFSQLEDSSRKLAIKYGLNIGNIIDGNYQLVSSMGDITDSQKVLESAAKLSIAGLTDYESAMNGLVAVINGYKMEAGEASKVADVLMTVQNKGVTTVGELQASLGKVIPTAAALGVQFEDVAAAMATITSNKIGTSEAVTYLNQALAELGKTGTQASKAFQEATGNTFISFINQGHSLSEALNKLSNYSKATGKNMLDMFGSIDAAKAVLNMTGENANKMADSLKAVRESAGTADQALKKFEDDHKRRFEKIKARLHDVSIEFGKALLPQIDKLTEKLEKVKWEEVFSEQNINKVIKIGEKVVVVTGAVWGLHTALKAIKSISEALILGKTFFSWLTGNLSLGAGGVTASKFLSVAATAGSLKILADTFDNIVINKDKGQKYDNNLNNYKGSVAKVDYLEKELEQKKKELNKLIRRPGFNSSRESSKDAIRHDIAQIKKRIKAIKATYSNEGYLSAPIGARITKDVKNNAVDGAANNSTFSPVVPKEIQDFVKTYKKEMQDLPKFWDLIGLTDKEKLENYLSFYKSKLQTAIELGQRDYVTLLTGKYNSIKSKLNSYAYADTITNYNKNSSGIAKMDLKQRFAKEQEEAQKAIEKLTALDAAKYKEDIKELERHKQYSKKREKAYKAEIKTAEQHAQKMEKINTSLNSVSSGFETIYNITGSKRVKTASNVFSGLTTVASSFSGLKGINSIQSLLSGGALGALSAFGGITAGVGAGIGVVNTLFGGNGKKKAAKIDVQNETNRKLYEQQAVAMVDLVKALEHNTQNIKSFSDRLTSNIAKNPTMNALFKGKNNLDFLYDNVLNNKHFTGISAIEKGSKKYRSGFFKKKRKDTFTKIDIDAAQLLSYLGFNNTDLNSYTPEELANLTAALKHTTHEDLVNATGKNLTESNIEDWKKQIASLSEQLNYLKASKNGLFEGATLQNFVGINYKEQTELVKEYTQQFQELGLDTEHYADTIKELASNNRVLVTAMEDVRGATIEGLTTGNGGFLAGTKMYFEKIFRNASSIAYDTIFSDVDTYLEKQFEHISNKLVDIKKSGKLDYSNLFDGFDFNKIATAQAMEKQANKALDVLKQQLLNSGIDISVINQILPTSDFNDRLNDLKNSLASALNTGLEERSFTSFTKTLGESLYNSTKNALVKAFSESSMYQGMIQKFIKAEDFQAKLEKAGSLQEAFKLSENVMASFGQELEAAGLGGFDAINNINRDANNALGNAYYTDRNSPVEIKITNNFYREIYSADDFEQTIRNTTQDSIKEFFNKPKILA